MFVSIGNSRMDKKFNCTDMTYEDFVSRLSKTKYTAETMEQYRKMPKGQQDNIKDVGGFVLGKLKGGRRKKDCVISRSAITLDMDYGTPGIIDELEMFFDMKMVVYSTHKHTPEKPRLRIIIFLTRDVTPDEYGAVSRMLASDIGIELFDDSTYEPSRLMYWPSTSSDGEYVFQEIEGNEVDPDEVLSRYKDWHDVSAWPVSNRQASVVQRDIKKQADPLSKDGLIGAFNRTYTVTQAIDKFIPDVYRHSRAIPGRYDYIPADSAAGVVVYDDLFVYSHHATDPCCGKLMNAFDVVRLHKFGDKDARVAEGTEPGKLPSFKAMQDFVSADEEVKNTLAKERQELAVQEFSTEPDEDWQNKLVLDRRGNIKDTLQNIALIIRNDENFKHIVYNEFKDTIDVIGSLPWKQVKPGWNDSDLANAKVYFERVYGIWSPTKFKDALLAVVSSDRLYHPIKDYFATLHWDGQERIRYVLHHFLGAPVDELTYESMKMFLLGAIARAFRPGIKFEYMLCLVGGQGVGKSTFFRFMAVKDDWFTDDIGKLDSEKVYCQLRGHWMIEMSEMVATARSKSIEETKSFLSRQKETYRDSYAVYALDRPRQCVFGGTSNIKRFLPFDRTGNRRFVPVQTNRAEMEVHILENEKESRQYIDQVWAEAMMLYRNGNFKLAFSKETEAQLDKLRQEFMADDTEAGMIQAWLDEHEDRKVCSLMLFKEALDNPYIKPKKAETDRICEIMNTSIVGWKQGTMTRFKDYGTQRSWVCVNENCKRDAKDLKNENDWHPITEKEARQVELPFQ